MFKIANVSQVPSYISLMTALAYYDVTTQAQNNYQESVCLKRSVAYNVREAVFRDAYDIEFLLKKGIALPAENEILGKLIAGLAKLGKKDFSVELGTLLDASARKYYVENGFRILEMRLRDKIQANA